MKNQVKYLLAAFLSVAIWGFFSIPLRHLNAYPSEEILYYRIFVSLGLIWLSILIFRRKAFLADLSHLKSLSKLHRRSLFFKLILASVLLTLNWYTFIFAVNHVSLKSAAFAYMVCPLITAFGGYIILKEHLARLQLVALGLAFLSIIWLGTGSLIDVMWSIIIATLYAFYLILQKKIEGLDKFNVLAFQISIAVFLMLPFYLHAHGPLPQTLDFWSSIILIAVVFTIVPLFLSLYALVGIPSSTLGIIIYLNPIIAFTVAIFYFGEEINIFQLIAYSFLLFAVILFNWNLIKENLNLNINKKSIANE